MDALWRIAPHYSRFCVMNVQKIGKGGSSTAIERFLKLALANPSIHVIWPSSVFPALANLAVQFMSVAKKPVDPDEAERRDQGIGDWIVVLADGAICIFIVGGLAIAMWWALP
jgi:hypothetical protein